MSNETAVRSRPDLPSGLRGLLREHREPIHARWFEEILKTYSPRSRGFLAGSKDCFANPAGAILTESTWGILDALIADADSNRLQLLIEPMVRLRAVQELSAVQAVGFVFSLKACIREVLRTDLHRAELYDEWLLLEAKLDEIALLAFQVFIDCREVISQLRIQEIKRTGFRLLKKAGLIVDNTGPPSDRQEVGGG